MLYLNNSALNLISMDCMFSEYPSVKHKELKNFFLRSGRYQSRKTKQTVAFSEKLSCSWFVLINNAI